jgi:penicillin-binding protein 2
MPKIPDVEVCAKTGTAENYRVLNKRRVQLKDHSLFVCFAPKDDPKIAIAVIVENGGFGATWAGPMAYLLMEKYLKDTLRTERLADVERIAAANLMPPWLSREQYREDSIRAIQWFKLTNDSAYIQKYIYKKTELPTEKDNKKGKRIFAKELMVLTEKKKLNKKQIEKG